MKINYFKSSKILDLLTENNFKILQSEITEDEFKRGFDWITILARVIE